MLSGGVLRHEAGSEPASWGVLFYGHNDDSNRFPFPRSRRGGKDREDVRRQSVIGVGQAIEESYENIWQNIRKRMCELISSTEGEI